MLVKRAITWSEVLFNQIKRYKIRNNWSEKSQLQIDSVNASLSYLDCDFIFIYEDSNHERLTVLIVLSFQQNSIFDEVIQQMNKSFMELVVD